MCTGPERARAREYSYPTDPRTHIAGLLPFEVKARSTSSFDHMWASFTSLSAAYICLVFHLNHSITSCLSWPQSSRISLPISFWNQQCLSVNSSQVVSYYSSPANAIAILKAFTRKKSVYVTWQALTIITELLSQQRQVRIVFLSSRTSNSYVDTLSFVTFVLQ